MRKSVHRIVAVVGVIMALALVTGILAALPLGTVERSMPAESNGLHPIPVSQIGGMQGLFKNAPPMRVVAAEQDSTFTGSASRWYQLSLAPADVASFEQSIKAGYLEPRPQQSGRRIESITAAECVALVRLENPLPKFWHPESLADVEVIRIGPYPYITIFFSRQSGTAYFYQQGH